jgi:acyl-CoA thioesterase
MHKNSQAQKVLGSIFIYKKDGELVSSKYQKAYFVVSVF